MITVTKNNEGYWLNFQSKSGKYASLHIVNSILNGQRGIIERVIIETCKEEDCAADYSENIDAPNETTTADRKCSCGGTYKINEIHYRCDKCQEWKVE